MGAFVAHGSQVAGFAHAGGGGSDLIHSTADASFANWDLASSIGPITGSGQILQFGLALVNTTGGTLFFSDAATPITFQATVGNATPEPGSLLLLISGAAVLGVLRFRSRLV